MCAGVLVSQGFDFKHIVWTLLMAVSMVLFFVAFTSSSMCPRLRPLSFRERTMPREGASSAAGGVTCEGRG